MRLRVVVLLSTLAFAVSSGSAHADNQKVEVQVVSQLSSPLQIQQCQVLYTNTVTPVGSTPTNTVTAVTYLSFEDGDTQDAVAVKFGFVFKDSFGEKLYTAYGENTGKYSPGVVISPNFNLSGYPRPGSPGAFQVSFPATGIGETECFVAAVRRADGTVWRYDSTPGT